MEIIGNCHSGSRKWTWVAPTLASPVVPARFCELRDFGLQRLPDKARAVSPGLENDRWPACSRTGNVERSATNIHRRSNLWEPRAILPVSYLLVDTGRIARGSHKLRSEEHT